MTSGSVNAALEVSAYVLQGRSQATVYFPRNAKAGQPQRAPSHNFRRVTSVAPPLNAPQMNGALPTPLLVLLAALQWHPFCCDSFVRALQCPERQFVLVLLLHSKAALVMAALVNLCVMCMWMLWSLNCRHT